MEINFSNENDSISVSVNEFVIQEINADDLTFRHPVCVEIFNQIADGISEGILYTFKYFMKSNDPQILELSTELIGFDDELSPNWVSQYRIYTKLEDTNLLDTVRYAVYNYKQQRIIDHIKQLRIRMSAEDIDEKEQIELLAEQMAYEKIKLTFANKLGRIILK